MLISVNKAEIMRILIVNKFMYPRGGDCLVALNTARLLREHGHEVRLYAMDYPDNLPVEEASSFAPRVKCDSSSLLDKFRALRRILGKGPIRRSFRRVVNEFRPDVVHLHNIHSYLSPIIGEIAYLKGVRVVWTLHDYKLLCPAYSCLRPDGTVCEDCFKGNLRVSKYRCMKGSRPASFIAHLEGAKWHKFRLENFTSAFICPSEFMAKCMLKGEYTPDKVKVLCNFADPDKFKGREIIERPDDYFCYVGRISREKGVATLLEAAVKAGVRMKIAGDGPLRESLETQYGNHPLIEFLGHLDADGVAQLLSHAQASVIPSEWYENNPLGVIESLSLGVPVIGADIGGIPELLRPFTSPEGKPIAAGAPFPSGNAEALAATLRDFKPESFNRKLLSEAAQKAFSPEIHYQKLMQIYLRKSP